MTKLVDRRQIVLWILMLSVLAAAWLAACGRKKTADPAPSAVGGSVPTIRVLGEDSSNLQAMKALNATKPFVGATVEFNPHSFEDALQKANLDFAQGTGLYDVVLQYNFSLSSFARNHYVYTVKELKDLAAGAPFEAIEQSLQGFPQVWKEIGWYYKSGSTEESEAVAIGYPFAANTMLLVTNREMFNDAENRRRYKEATGQELAPPTTWEEFAKIAAFFTNPGKGTYGVCLQGQQGGWLYYEWCNFLYGMGGAVMKKNHGWAGDSTTEIEVDNGAAVRAAKFYADLKPFNAGDFLATGATEQRVILLQGKTAMAIVWSDYLFGLVADGATKGIHFDFSMIPGGKAMIAGGSFYVNRKSKNADTAARYLLDLLQEQNQVQLMLKGLCSPVRSVYLNPEVLAAVPYAPALRESLDHGVYMLEAGPDADAIQAVITEQLQRIWQGDTAIEERLREARKQIEQRRNTIWQAVESGG